MSKIIGKLITPPYQHTDDYIPDDDDPYSDAVFLSADAVYVDVVQNTNSSQWNITLTVGEQLVLFKVDTAAEVTALSEKTCNLLHDSVPKLQKSTQKLCGSNRAPLDVLGVAQMYLSYNSKSISLEVFLV